MRTILFLVLCWATMVTSCFAVPLASNIFIVMEENHGYSQVVGDSSMPYFNSLIPSGASDTNQFANSHPSLPNYLTIASGSSQGITKDECFTSVPPLTGDNVINELIVKGITWRGYYEGLPSQGSMVCGAGGGGGYVARHNPFPYFATVRNSRTQQLNMYPSTQLAVDISHNIFARYNFIVPDICDDMHGDPSCANGCFDGSQSACYRAADNWLNTYVKPLFSTPMFNPTTGSAALIVMWDEGQGSTHGGGQIAGVWQGPHIKVNYKSTVFHQHQAVCKESLEALGVTHFPTGCAAVADMAEVFSR